jgi:hypothetical protein
MVQENTFEKKIQDAFDAAQKQNLNQIQLQNLILDIQKELDSYKTSLKDVNSKHLTQLDELAQEISLFTNNIATNFKDIENIPGVRTPKIYEVLIDFDFEDTSLKFNSVEINPEGPFVITQITPLWQVVDKDLTHFANYEIKIPDPPDPLTFIAADAYTSPNGRILPCTAYPMIINCLGITNSAQLGYNVPNYIQLFNRYTSLPALRNIQWGALSDIPEFDFQIEVAGSGKFFTNQPISAASLYGYGGQPMYTGVQGWAERGDKIVIHATPTIPMPHTGRVRFCLHGYQILGDINIGQALGYFSNN